MQLALVTQRRHHEAGAKAAGCTDPLPPRIRQQLHEKKNAPSYSNITKFVKSKPFTVTQAGRVTVQVTHTCTHTCFNAARFALSYLPTALVGPRTW